VLLFLRHGVHMFVHFRDWLVIEHHMDIKRTYVTIVYNHFTQKIVYMSIYLFVYPKPGKNMLKFDKVHYQFRVPFAVYVNFKSFFTEK